MTPGTGPDQDPVLVLVRAVEPTADRDQSAVVSELLRTVSSALSGAPETAVSIGRDPSGRPRVEVGATRLWVSVSHCERVVAVAARRNGPVGVDVESRGDVPAVPLARRWFHQSEVDWLEGLDEHRRAEAFRLLWTAKEAVGKALGTGLRGGGTRRLVPRPQTCGDPVLRPVPGEQHVLVGHPAVGADVVLALAVAGVRSGGIAVSVLE